MAKWANDDVMDAALAEVATSSRMVVCDDQPTDYADIANHDLADVALTPGDGNGDFTIGNGDASGRKVRVSAQEDVDIDTSGDADHVTLDDGVELQYVTTCTEQALTQGGTVTVGAWDVEIADPS